MVRMTMWTTWARSTWGWVALVMMITVTAGCLPRTSEEEELDPDGDGVDRFADCDSTDPDITFFALWRDQDADGWGDEADYYEGCERLEGYVEEPGDCDDLDPLNFPTNPEDCDGLDNDCDDAVDEGVPASTPWYADADGDGFGDPDDSLINCFAPEGYIAQALDCDDGDVDVNPDAAPVCGDAIDNDCDGLGDCESFGLHDEREHDANNPYAGVSSFVSDYAFTELRLGDVTGDGVAEVIAGDRFAEGTDGVVVVWQDQRAHKKSAGAAYATLTILGSNAAMGASLSLGDLDGDAVVDLIVGAQDASSSEGAVYIGFGPLASGSIDPSTSRDFAIVYGDNAGEELGAEVAVMDWNRDGKLDLLMGAPGVKTKGSSGANLSDSGAVYVLPGPIVTSINVSEAAASLIWSGQEDARLGERIAPIGDLDGDGDDEVALAMPELVNSGRSSGRVVIVELDGHQDLASPDLEVTVLTGGTPSSRLGDSLCGGQDFTGDGLHDLILGDSTYSSDKGIVWLLDGAEIAADVAAKDGASAKIDDAAYAKITGTGTIELGADVACLGDADDDGRPEIAVSASSDGVGAVYVFTGQLSAGSHLLTDADGRFSSPSSSLAPLGETLGVGGDVNGYGRDDLAISADNGSTVLIWPADAL
jgi:hypothetical protein